MIKNSKILITGGTGSLGYALAHALVEQNDLVIYSRNEERQYLMQSEFGKHRNKLTFLIGDVRDQVTLENAMRGCDIVIHAAAMKDLIMCETQATQTYLNNIIGTQTVIQAVKNTPSVKKVCAVSTDKAAAPTSVYGASKYIMEKMISEAAKYSDKVFSCVRFGNMIDSRGSIITVWRDNPPKDIKITHPDLTRFFFTVEDAANTVIDCIETAKSGDIYIRKMKAARIKDIFTLLTGKKEFPVKGLYPGEKIHEDLTSAQELPYCFIEGDYYVIKEGKLNPKPPKHLSSETADILTSQELRAMIGIKNG